MDLFNVIILLIGTSSLLVATYFYYAFKELEAKFNLASADVEALVDYTFEVNKRLILVESVAVPSPLPKVKTKTKGTYGVLKGNKASKKK